MEAFLEEHAKLRLRTLKCAAYPTRWANFCRIYKPVWRTIKFSPNNRARVPDRPGIYCFFVGNRAKQLPRVGYPLYVGITGISSKNPSSRTLRKRFAEYIREKDSPWGRHTVRVFLNVFDGELEFLCSAENMSPQKLKEMERQLSDALMPVYSSNDFTAEIAAQRRAW